jgi:signal transduction histidine kinase
MDTQKYDIGSIKEYLLGSLSETEMESFDELSVADANFAELLDSVENDLVDSYASGELSADDLAKFKSHYLASPRRREKVGFAETLRDFSRPGGAVKPAETVFATPAVAKRRSLFDIFSTPAFGWGFAVAALLLAFLSGWFFMENSRLRRGLNERASATNTALEHQQELERQIETLRQAGDQSNQEVARLTSEQQRLEQELEDAKTETRATEERQKQEREQQRQAAKSGGSTIASFILTPPVRGSGQLQRLTVPPTTSRVALRLELEPNDFFNFRAVLKDQTTGRTVWSSGVIKASKGDAAASLNLSLPARLLSPTVYTLTLSGVSGGGAQETISDYAFQVVR